MYIVTGASAGIGRAVASRLAARKLQVTAVARSQDQLDSLAKQHEPFIRAVAADLSTKGGIEQTVASVNDQANISGVVHAAGSLVPLEPYQVLQQSDLERHFRIHVGAPIALNQSLCEQKALERIVYIDSYSASAARDEWAAYSIIKAAAQMAARCAAQELSTSDIIRIFPGAVRTQIVDNVLASRTETAKVFAQMLERGEFAEPHEVAEFIVELLVDAPSELVLANEFWDYNNPDHRQLLRG